MADLVKGKCRKHGVTDFYNYKPKGNSNVCRTCAIERRATRRKLPEVQEYDRKHAKEWSLKNPDKVRESGRLSHSRQRKNKNDLRQELISTLFQEHESLIRYLFVHLKSRYNYKNNDLQRYFYSTLHRMDPENINLHNFIETMRRKLKTKHYANEVVKLKGKLGLKETYCLSDDDTKNWINSEAMRFAIQKSDQIILEINSVAV